MRQARHLVVSVTVVPILTKYMLNAQADIRQEEQ